MFIPEFQVTDCARTLMAVRVQTAVGNFVVFRPQNYLRPIILQQFEQDELEQLEESTWWKNRQFLVGTSESQMMALGVEDRLCEKVLRFAMVEERRNEAQQGEARRRRQAHQCPDKDPERSVRNPNDVFSTTQQ